MGSENLEIVRRGYAAMDARDTDAIEEISSADVEWISDPRTGIGTLRDRDEALAAFLA
jgi:ketosteroid isomerase-like protein